MIVRVPGAACPPLKTRQRQTSCRWHPSIGGAGLNRRGRMGKSARQAKNPAVDHPTGHHADKFAHAIRPARQFDGHITIGGA
jgi:hypothetical protein